MVKQIQLISLYCTVCQHYYNRLVATAQRQSNNFCPKFTDEECITIYIWGLLEQRFDVKSIYNFIKDYYNEWFPTLPSYQAFNKRLCYLADTFKALAEILLCELDAPTEVKTYLIDSMPIVVANQKRSNSACSASEVCNKGYCGSKGLYYYGVKLHLLAQSKFSTLPIPRIISITPASENDLPVAKAMLDDVYDIDIFADKMYKDSEWEKDLRQSNNVTINTPVKLNKGQAFLESADRLLSQAVSSVRQPIEAFFNWLQVKTHIQSASTIRSANGLFAFIFARIATACFLFQFNC